LVDDYFFDLLDGDSLYFRKDFAFALDHCYGPLTVVDWCGIALGEESHRLTYRLVWPGADRERVLAIRFNRWVRYLDIAMSENLYLHMLLCLNPVMCGHYELWRFCGREPGNGDDILVPRAPTEWRALRLLHGGANLKRTFERIIPYTKLEIRADLLTRERWRL